MQKRDIQGFTLIEIIVVVVIISILSVFGIQMINSGSIERNLQQQGRILQATMEYACEQATLQNIPYGVSLTQNAYTFSQFVNQQWLPLSNSDVGYSKELSNNLIFSLEIEDLSVVLNEEFPKVPQIVCDTTGQLTPFNLVFLDELEKHRYLLKNKGLWELEGQWLDEE